MALNVASANIDLPPRVRDRRIGRFSITLDIIERYPETVRCALRDMIVVRAEMVYWSESIDYVAISPLFAEAPPNLDIPVYAALFDAAAGTMTWTRRP